jgi:hypothetical protein
MTTNINYKHFYHIIPDNNIFIQADIFRKMNDYTDLITHIIETTNDCLKNRKNNNETNCFKIFIDLSNVKLKHADYDFLKMLIPFLENAYPDNLEKMYFQNTPFIFKTVYTIIRRFIDKETRAKITFMKKYKESNKGDVEEVSEDKMDELF